MPKSIAKSNGARSTNGSTKRSMDAVAVLKADHRQVEKWFEQFEKARANERKQALATNICHALRIHTLIEEEVFYPAFLEATEDQDLHHEAEIEHSSAKKLIAEIEASGPSDEYYDAKVKVLSEMIKHHVKEEEQRGGMFAKARAAKMDLKALGEQLVVRKAQAESSQPSSLQRSRSARNGGARATA